MRLDSKLRAPPPLSRTRTDQNEEALETRIGALHKYVHHIIIALYIHASKGPQLNPESGFFFNVTKAIISVYRIYVLNKQRNNKHKNQ